MNRKLLRIGGAVDLLFVLFHSGMVAPIAAEFAPMSSDIRATVSTLNVQVTFTFLIFAYFAIFRSRDLLITPLGNLMAVAIALFWFLRGVDQAFLYQLSTADVPLIGICVVTGLLHALPVIIARRGGAASAASATTLHAEPTGASPRPAGGLPWSSYAAVAWCIVFGGLHLYWALGGNVGFAEFSTPPSKFLALERDPFYIGVTWGVVGACVVAAIVALAPFHKWTRRIPRWMLLTPLWIVCGLFLLRGFGNPIQAAVLAGGAMPFEHLSTSEAQAWAQWTQMDLMYFSPWFILGGFAFWATSRAASQRVPP